MENEVVKTEPIEMNLPQLLQMAVQSGASIEILERLMVMREKLRAEQAEILFREALSGFQRECPVIKKNKPVLNKDGKTTRYKYAPLDEIVKRVQPIIAKFQFSYDIETKLTEGIVQVVVTVYHAAGHSKHTSFEVPIDKESYMNEPQRFASAQTFAKRYAFCNAFGILTGDDDNDAGAVDHEVDKQKEKAKQEALKKLESLPEKVKMGFDNLGYNEKSRYSFCDKFGWDNQRIMKEINTIVDMKKVGKK